jgi:hypothetical protein
MADRCPKGPHNCEDPTWHEEEDRRRRFQQDGDPIDIRLDDDEIHGYGEEE